MASATPSRLDPLPVEPTLPPVSPGSVRAGPSVIPLAGVASAAPASPSPPALAAGASSDPLPPSTALPANAGCAPASSSASGSHTPRPSSGVRNRVMVSEEVKRDTLQDQRVTAIHQVRLVTALRSTLALRNSLHAPSRLTSAQRTARAVADVPRSDAKECEHPGVALTRRWSLRPSNGCHRLQTLENGGSGAGTRAGSWREAATIVLFTIVAFGLDGAWRLECHRGTGATDVAPGCRGASARTRHHVGPPPSPDLARGDGEENTGAHARA